MRPCSFATVASSVLLAAPALSQSIVRASVSSSGVQGNWFSYRPSLSADGRYVAFDSIANNLVPGDTNSNDGSDVFVMDLRTGIIERVSVGHGQANDSSSGASISGDGRYVAFVSDATNLVGTPAASHTQVYVHDRVTGTNVRASVDSSGNPGDNGMVTPPILTVSLSRDGTSAAFDSSYTNLVPGGTSGQGDIFVHDLSSGTTELVSLATNGVRSNGISQLPVVSGDGRFVAFTSTASNLVPGDTNIGNDVFLRDRQAGTTELVSISMNGGFPNGESIVRSISADGRFVAFSSKASDLVPNDTNGVSDGFIRDRLLGVTERVSVSSAGVQGNFDTYNTVVSDDGRWVAFESRANNLVAQPFETWFDVFLRDRLNGQTTILSMHPDSPLSADQDSRFAAISGDGHRVAFVAEADNLVDGDVNGAWDVVVWSDLPTPAAPMVYGTGTFDFAQCFDTISVNGSPSLSSIFDIQCTGATPNMLGIMLYGTSGSASIPFGSGTLYVAPPLNRSPASTSHSVSMFPGCGGTWSINMTAFALGMAGGNPLPSLATPGTTVNCQWWGRDGPTATQLSNAIQYVVAP
jgi:hypothetical protein